MTRAPVVSPGVDLIEISRVERALERRPRLADRLFRSGELAYARTCRRPGRQLAARFAAKEAALKALGGSVPLRDIEVVRDGRAPKLQLHGRAARLASERRITLEVSLTHSREMAAAVVVARPAADELAGSGPQ